MKIIDYFCAAWTKFDILQADVILLMTCAIREGAEDKVWSRLEYFKSLKRKRQGQSTAPVTIGILGIVSETLILDFYRHKVARYVVSEVC